ncbi:(4Fe-4S)-binding protein [Puteibacter caeruleilacunae]|nr:(4Fe-4S)-binding protein [Puteibacter caeruleilacunae]
MQEITILSGKGGTGKTSISAALASVAQNKILCDNDVDAADLHLILKPEIEQKEVFAGAWIPHIDDETCISCGKCKDLCRYGAIHQHDDKFSVNRFQCEGCRLCERECPVNAITSERSTNNNWYISNTRMGKMVHAKMGPGEENSGKLVSLIRSKAKELAKKNNNQFIINDGPPGIGCTAISSLTGTDKVLLVIEPTRSGLHDAGRIVELIERFNIPCFALINKYDINQTVTHEIELYLEERGIDLLAKIPFDKTFVEAMIKEQTIVEYAPKSNISKEIETVWNQLIQ